MDMALILLMVFGVWIVLRTRYQRTHIALLAQHLANLQLERHMETLTQGYTRAIHEKDENRQLQVLAGFATTEKAVAGNIQTLARSMQKESRQAASLIALPFCLPYAEHFLPSVTRDFRKLLHIHAAGLQYAAENEGGWSPKDRAFHLSAELYLLQHSCHWFCKSRGVADARLMLRHQIKHQDALESVAAPTRSAYLKWMQNADA
ncbi:hypothetical protein LKR43_01360 [Pusillimonas sp. MFBS29]|uniref:hypothetical protein n=1 Tax=Pusillimonas sp. MFBS29 TaxID=2886690 RepID=UPI001D11BC89|nr:hypothetical protein [Pusillimonas sp. MFBS29]MCC2594981.1 hypothetical protein [Pusillimonas sp. MFBS29]